MAAVKVFCTICKQDVALTASGRYGQHGRPRCRKSRRPWPIRLGKRRIVLTPGPDTWNPTQGVA